jgi:hypothetical protein
VVVTGNGPRHPTSPPHRSRCCCRGPGRLQRLEQFQRFVTAKRPRQPRNRARHR